jgi:hypothetical protein
MLTVLILRAGGRGYGDESLSFFQIRIANNWNNRVEQDDVGGTCRPMGKREMLIGYWWESQRERDD